MAKLFSLSVESLKRQSKKLRESLAIAGHSLTHSQCLEMIAHLHGFRDWNVAVAQVESPLKLYVACCSFGDPFEKDQHWSFQHLVQARTRDEAIETCKSLFDPTLNGPRFAPFSERAAKGVFLDRVIEVDSIGADGMMINVTLHDSDGNLRPMTASLP